MANSNQYELHHMYAAVRKARIGFPCSKADCIAKAGDLTVKVAPDKAVPMREIIEQMPLDYYENGMSFYSALYYMVQRR